MSTIDFLDEAQHLVAAGEAFAIATVVRFEPPASARPGAKAIIRADGSMRGWVGGSCAQPLVVKEAQRALGDGRSRLVRLCPTAGDGGSQQPDLVEYLMTCHSGGTLEIFVEPVFPAPRLVLIGETPVVHTLAALGQTLGFRTELVPVEGFDAALPPEPLAADASRSYVVVATMGTADEEAIEAALRGTAPYVALVASPRRAAVLHDYLADRGLTADQLARLRATAGLNIGAETQEEIALSIMAEIVQYRATHDAARPLPVERPIEARDPVCGMNVTVSGARFTLDHDGSTYYFCCGHCKTSFAATPLAYAAATG